jgi:hypothetical protein
VAVAVAYWAYCAVAAAVAVAVGLAVAVAVAVAVMAPPPYACAKAADANTKTITALTANRSIILFTGHPFRKTPASCPKGHSSFPSRALWALMLSASSEIQRELRRRDVHTGAP